MLTYEQNVKAVLECIFAGYKDELIEDACRRICALSSSENPNKWIPVSERLPENDTIVLVTFASGMVSMSSWHENTQYNNGFDNMGHGITEDGTVLNYGTVAWMPLPEPHKPQESEVK